MTPVADTEQKPDLKNETLPTGKIQKILKSKNCTIGKLIEISGAGFQIDVGKTPSTRAPRVI